MVIWCWSTVDDAGPASNQHLFYVLRLPGRYINNNMYLYIYMYIHSHINCIINPCAAGAVYIRFRVSFRKNKMTLKSIKQFVIDARLIKMLIFTQSCLFFINSHIFHHLKLEIALAIPALNDEKYNKLKQSNRTRVKQFWCIKENPLR